MTGLYDFAGKKIAVTSIYPDLHRCYAGYETDGTPDFSVTVTQADIEFEQTKSDREAIAEGIPQQTWPPQYLEELSAYRKIAEKMPYYDTVLFHVSVIAADGEGFLFTAKSGTGKSTHTRLWRQMLGERAVMVNDDKPLLTVGQDGVTAHGTPYNGKHGLGCRMSVPLRGLCILQRGTENHIERISKAQVYPMLLQQVYRPQDAAQLRKTLLLIDRLAAVTPLYRLSCNMEPEAAEVAYRGMKGETV